MRQLFTTSIIKPPKNMIEKSFFDNIVQFVNSTPMGIEEVREGVLQIKQKYNLGFQKKQNHINNIISEIRVNATIRGSEHVKTRQFTVISENRKTPSMFVNESFFRDSTRGFSYVECKLNGDKENKIPPPFTSNIEEKVELQLRELKFEKAKIFEDLNDLIISEKENIHDSNLTTKYGMICFNVKKKELELLSLSKNIIE